MDNSTSGQHLSEEPQAERGAPGSRDTGSDKPSGGPTDRPEGAVGDAEEVPSHGGAEEAQYGGAGTRPPADTEPAVPPYEGRQTTAKPGGEEGGGGAVKPAESSSGTRAPAPESTVGGATASPGDEQPAAEQTETDRDDDRAGPAHTAGTSRGENQR
jgi:hypothetical protein